MFTRFTPTPAPTVTETVLVTPPPPVINVQMPTEAFDFWRDVVLTGDFVGSVLAVIGGFAAGWMASRIVVRGDRRAREEDNRRALALEYATAARQLSNLLHIGSQPDQVKDVLEGFDLLTGRLVRFYSQQREHRKYVNWIMVLASPIGIGIHMSLLDKEGPYGRIVDNDKLDELRTDLKVIEHSTLEWIRSPKDWKPDTSAHEARERVKKLLSGPNVTPQAEPTPPSSRASDDDHTP